MTGGQRPKPRKAEKFHTARLVKTPGIECELDKASRIGWLGSIAGRGRRKLGRAISAYAHQLERGLQISVRRILRECGDPVLHLTNTPVPLLGTNFVFSPEMSGLRSIAHFAFFLVTFYLGFIRK